MKDFMTDSHFNVTNDDKNATFLFEHVESYANGISIQVQRKNENGLWGGRGDDVVFTCYGKSITRSKVVQRYCEVLEELDEEELDETA